MSGALVIGLGNRLRGDDAVGLEVARLLAARKPGLDVVAHEGEVIDLLEIWSEAGWVVVVDAVPGGDSGRVHRLDAREGKIAWERGAASSSHVLHLGQVIELADSLGRLPQHLEMIAIEGCNFAMGAEPSASVRAAANHVVDELLVELPVRGEGVEA